MRCDKDGGACTDIGGATDAAGYTLLGDDVGHTIRLRVAAKNADGTTSSTSVPTAVIASAAVAPPQASSPPTVTGTPKEGQKLVGHNGSWTGSPTSYTYSWLRCDSVGSSCSSIGGATDVNGYILKKPDVGTTLRLRVEAKNGGGTTTATSDPTVLIAAGSSAPAPAPSGCAKSGGTIPIGSVSAPARLTIDQAQIVPRTVTFNTNSVTARFHVSACNGPVQGALIYVTAVPYAQFTIPNEQATGSDGWVTLQLNALSGFPVSGKQQLLVMFVRARKGGEPVLAGISSRRLVSFRVTRG